MESHNKWKIKFSIIMVIAIIVIYGSNILILKDPEHVISYIWTHLGFIPVDILIVAFLLDEIISKKEKETMINETFYMLSDEDKKEVIENIDSYSLDDIEAKLSILCVRNKVSFSEEEEQTPAANPMTYNVTGMEEDNVPAWIKAVLDKQKTM